MTAIYDVELITVTTFLILLGPSGCGRTTTLRLIGGFEHPDSGEMVIRGQPMGRTPPYRRPTSMVFQNYALFPHLTVAENIAYGLRERRVDRITIQRRVREMLELVALQGLENRYPRQLSGGQQQRVALGRSLVIEPAVLLLDEPLGALDLKLRRQMQLELKQLQTQVGITFIYVTHDQEEALTMSDRVAVMNHGRIEQLGTPEELYERPRTRFVAEFLGAANVLPAVVRAADATSACLEIAGHRLTVPVRGLTPGRPEALVVRPHWLTLRSAENDSVVWQGTVAERIYKGSTITYRVEMPGAVSVLVDVPTGSGVRVFSVGEAVTVGVDPSRVHVVTE
ncbi:ABC transporter ATP-binding protein [Thermomicrobium sp. CFH 73360]|uniref:ABC transporter ATP-binding protein n=1 Tax=Thermomicrobium sp. CFH 73360 TaxID=2951987 RepID=UPI00207709E1|nr:ABC transporter ATP-binding protein [Thermomicrobium sp. CFH 73360]MCM8747242.1 ABC transporter ATP-binding protein [Thermomicrobium sp. CFH 73360]